MTTEQFTELMNELRTLRAVIAGKQSLASSAAPASASKPASSELPQPSELVEHPEEVTVHFGKNQGVPIGSLNDRSIEWYAKDPEPRLKKDGTPFPPRAEDVRLRNACRQLLHTKRGTLAGGVTLKAEPIKSTPSFDDEVAF